MALRVSALTADLAQRCRKGVSRPNYWTVIVFGGVSLPCPVLVSADHLFDLVAEGGEGESCPGRAVTSGVPAIHNDWVLMGMLANAWVAMLPVGMWSAPVMRPCRQLASPRESISTNEVPLTKSACTSEGSVSKESLSAK